MIEESRTSSETIIKSERDAGTAYHNAMDKGLAPTSPPEQTTTAAMATPSQDGRASILPTVLMVDDESLMHLLYKQHVEKAGYQLLTARSAQEGLGIAILEKPSLIVLDIYLGSQDGLAVLRALKVLPETRAIPVIIFSGVGLRSHHAFHTESLNAGAAAFLTKPISPAQLLTEIKRLVSSPAAE